MGDPELTRLAEQAREGSAPASRALLRKIAPIVLSTARKVLRDPTEAEDVAQEALLQFARDVGSLREAGAVVAFAARLTTRLAIRSRQRRRRERDVRTDLAQQLAGDPARATADPAASRETAEQLLAVLDELPDEQAETLLLRYFMGHTIDEVAAATGVPANTVRSRVRLARQSLARILAEDPRFAALEEVVG